MIRIKTCIPHAIAALALTGAICAPALAADSPELPAAPVVSDQTLAQIRGKYVPPNDAQNGNSAPLFQDALRSPAAPLSDASKTGSVQSAAVSPLSAVPAAQGRVTYFGVEMVSTWTQQGAGGVQGASVGVNVGIDLEHNSVTLGKWSSSTGGGLSTAPGTGTINGSPTSNITTGVGQTVQIAGNGNTISNTAVVQVGSSLGTTVVPTTNTCAQQCTISVGANGIGIGISTPQGSVLQSIGPNGITQSAQVTSDMNTITNQLGAQVRIVPTNTFNPGSLLPILQTLGGIQ